MGRLSPAFLTPSAHRSRQLLTLSPLIMATRLTHTAATTPSERHLVEELRSFVPPTFTSLPHISRQVPPDLMESISSPGCGGLRLLLSRYPELFETKTIGHVHVARRRPQSSGNAKELLWRGRSMVLGDGAASGLRSHERTSKDSQCGSTAPAETDYAVTALQRLFPEFLVPVKALWTTVAECEEAGEKARVLSALQAHQGDHLIFHAHPSHRVACDGRPEVEKSVQGLREAIEKVGSLGTTVLENGYVQLRSSSATSLSTPSQDLPARLADYKIQPYEWYRVARVLPTAAADVVFDAALYDAAAALLPLGRDVWQVIFSAPHLFAVRYADATQRSACAMETQPTLPAKQNDVAFASVRFKLHPRFIPAGAAYAREEDLLRELEHVALNRDANRCGLTTRQRRHRRKLQQQLTYLRNPSPYFDTRVLAQHIFDMLPMRDGVHQAALLGSLPPHAVNAFPQNVTDLLKERTDLFRLSDARHGVLVQRADAPVEENERTVDSVTGEEVLQCIFSCYSTRIDPRTGTTISRNLSRLPRLIRERLFAMRDVVEELLCLYPEKVALLSGTTPLASPHSSSPSSSFQHGTELDERARRELQNVRGRRDFLIPFRFVGEWEEQLMAKYTRQKEKESAKSGSQSRTAGNRRPRY